MQWYNLQQCKMENYIVCINYFKYSIFFCNVIMCLMYISCMIKDKLEPCSEMDSSHTDTPGCWDCHYYCYSMGHIY